MIKPIGIAQQKAVVDATADYVEKAQELYNSDFSQVTINFDLKGRAAGMYRVQKGERVIRYNPWLFAKYYSDNLAVTVPHEVAHYITDMVYGLRNIRPHGPEWKALMAKFGADSSRTCNYDLEGIPQRVVQRFPYRCDCTHHELTAYRHNQISEGKKLYLCRQCSSPLVPTTWADGAK
jgi:SprT protein